MFFVYYYSMLRIIWKLLSIPYIIFRRKVLNPDSLIEERWIADFSKTKQIRFDIKTDTLYDASIQKFNSQYCLVLGIKKTNAIVWTDFPGYKYGDLIIQGRLYIDSRGSYAAGGMMFRKLDDKNYYFFIISSKGYFRLDLVRNNMPYALIGWTELPDIMTSELTRDHGIDFTIINYGSKIVLLIRGCWVAEINDTAILNGEIAFTAASYEADSNYDNFTSDEVPEFIKPGSDISFLLSPLDFNEFNQYSAEVFLESLTIESRFSEVSQAYESWKDDALTFNTNISPKARLNLAETFTALGKHSAALIQIQKAWKYPDYNRSQKELLLAGRLAQLSGYLQEAKKYINECIEKNVNAPEAKEAVSEMAKIIYEEEKYSELKDYCKQASKLKPNDPALYNLLGHACFNLKDYPEAAKAYDKAYTIDPDNGIFAKNAANVYDILGKKKKALQKYLAAGKTFLSNDNYNDLGLVVPKLLQLGKNDAEAHGLAGKWAYAVEDWDMAWEEITLARDMEKKKQLPKDAALTYLEALLFIRDGDRREALYLLEEAVSLRKDYALFYFKLAENRYLLDNDPKDKRLMSNLKAALKIDPDDGWLNNFAAQLSLANNDLDAAQEYLEKAHSSLGDHPAIMLNRALLLTQKGSLDEALVLLSRKDIDYEPGMALNCAGNILVEAGRMEEADEYYRRAVLAAPDNIEYLRNRAAYLIEMGYLGEADTVLTKLLNIASSASVLESISFVAYQKGEYERAEAACLKALELDPDHVPSLLSLGWVYVKLQRLEEALEIIEDLNYLELSQTAALRRDDLFNHLDSILNTTISCASCENEWRVAKEPTPIHGIRLFATPPDNMPAGSCQTCGETWCIGCAKKNLDKSGRFICRECKKPLRLTDEGLKKIIYDWGVQDGLIKKNALKMKKRKRKESKGKQ